MQRLICLDGVRGALAFYVMLSHMAPFAAMPAQVAALLSHGGAAVDVFFILSGLVITRSLEGLGWQSWPFLIARASRIFPVYLAMFALALAVQPLPTSFDAMPWIAADSPARSIWSDGWPRTWIAEIVSHLTMTHGLFPAGTLPDAWVSFLGAAWSLSTEWQFYLLVLVSGQYARSAGTDVLPRLVVGFLALGAAGIAWQIAAPVPWQFSRAFLPNKAQYFALGIASAILVRGGRWRGYASALFGTLLLCGAPGTGDKLLPPLLWTLCLIAQLRPGMPGLGLLHRLLSTRPMVWLGAVSYCIYLANEPIQKPLGIVLAWVSHGNGTVFTLLWMPLAILLPLLTADWLHRRVEAPALRWGRTLARRAASARQDGTAWAATSPAGQPTGPMP